MSQERNIPGQRLVIVGRFEGLTHKDIEDRLPTNYRVVKGKKADAVLATKEGKKTKAYLDLIDSSPKISHVTLDDLGVNPKRKSGGKRKSEPAPKRKSASPKKRKSKKRKSDSPKKKKAKKITLQDVMERTRLSNEEIPGRLSPSRLSPARLSFSPSNFFTPIGSLSERKSQSPRRKGYTTDFRMTLKLVGASDIDPFFGNVNQNTSPAERKRLYTRLISEHINNGTIYFRSEDDLGSNEYMVEFSIGSIKPLSKVQLGNLLSLKGRYECDEDDEGDAFCVSVRKIENY
jgi:hypothetical protein